jgi:hypothetical protein
MAVNSHEPASAATLAIDIRLLKSRPTASHRGRQP